MRILIRRCQRRHMRARQLDRPLGPALAVRVFGAVLALTLLTACVQPVTAPTATPAGIGVMPSITVQAQGIATVPIPALATPPASTPSAATVVVASGQAIGIESPPAGSIVGSPVTVIGRVARDPASGQLSFAVRNAQGAQIGGGSFATVPASSGASFVVSLTFTEPPAGGPIFVEIADPGRATTAVQLVVAPPQAIIFESPAAGTLVGSPMTITGRTARYPFQGALSYAVYDAANRAIGEGIVPVQGQPGLPGSFVAEVRFSLPPTGGDILVELTDVDAISGIIATKQSLLVKVANPPTTTSAVPPTAVPSQTPAPLATTGQSGAVQVTIESPIPVSQVRSPFAITGRVSALPIGSVLRYRVRDAAGKLVGEGLIPVAGTAGQPAQFSGTVGFILQQSGPIVLEIGDTDASGNLRTNAIIVLNAVVG